MKSLQKTTRSALCGLLLLFLMANLSVAQQWTRFRGPNGTGISPARGIPSGFSLSEANWRVALRGEGHSSPVVWAGRVFVTGFDAEN